MASFYDPENEPEKAAFLSTLSATGEYVDVSVSCSSCKGAFTALAKRSVIPRFSQVCVFCGSEDASVTIIDMQEA